MDQSQSKKTLDGMRRDEPFQQELRRLRVNICKYGEIREVDKKVGIFFDDQQLLASVSYYWGINNPDKVGSTENPEQQAVDDKHAQMVKDGVIKKTKCVQGK